MARTMPIASAAETVGLRTTLFAAAVGSALASVPTALSPLRTLRELPPEPAISVEPLRASHIRS